MVDDKFPIGDLAKILVPAALVGGGLYIAYRYFVGKDRFAAAQNQWKILFNAYMDKVSIFHEDGVLEQWESDEIEREQPDLDNATKAMADAVDAADPIMWVIQYLTPVAGGLLIWKYAGRKLVQDLLDWVRQHQAAKQAATQYSIIYEATMMADILSTAEMNPILATQKMTATQQHFNTIMAPSMQMQSSYLYTHMNQFTGINLLYAQYMAPALLLDVSFIQSVMFPFGFSLIPMI